VTDYDWDAAASNAGIREGRFNCATLPMTQEKAVIWCRDDGSKVTLSGHDLQRQARRLAAALAALGVRPGDRVAAMLGRRPEAFTLPLATWQLGAIYVPLFSGFGSEAMRVRLEDSGAWLLVVDAPNSGVVQPIRNRLDRLVVVALDDDVEPGHSDRRVPAVLAASPREPGLYETSPRDPATIMYTSGTTGPPKGCVIPHHGVLTLWPFVDHCLAVGPGSVLFSTADAGWSFGLYTTGLAPMTRGATRVICEGGFDAREWWRIAAETGAAHFASAPTGYRQLGAAGTAPLEESRPGALVAGTSCGEPLTTEIVEWFREHVGFTIHDSYGATELGMLIADLRDGTTQPVLGSMGRRLPGFEIDLLDDAGEPVAEGGIGRVAVRDHGWLLSVDYWNRSHDWNCRLRDGWWITEDLVRRDGDRYWYIGRADDVIVTAGYNVGPTDVENCLLRHRAIIDAACVGEADERKGQVIAAHVVLADGVSIAEEDLLAELRQVIGEQIGWHAAPRHLHVADVLPRTESGKIRRNALRTGHP
jgi:acetyl-CoA synthetase